MKVLELNALKVWPEEFLAVWEGGKAFEIRPSDGTFRKATFFPYGGVGRLPKAPQPTVQAGGVHVGPAGG